VAGVGLLLLCLVALAVIGFGVWRLTRRKAA